MAKNLVITISLFIFARNFLIDGKITVEVGGQDKSFDQIADIPNSYILADSMEFPVGKKLPLWVVGLLY